jgi:hypothetical protein
VAVPGVPDQFLTAASFNVEQWKVNVKQTCFVADVSQRNGTKV